MLKTAVPSGKAQTPLLSSGNMEFFPPNSRPEQDVFKAQAVLT